MSFSDDDLITQTCGVVEPDPHTVLSGSRNDENELECTATTRSTSNYPLLCQVSPLWVTGKRKRERSLLELTADPPKPRISATVPSSALSIQDSRYVPPRPADLHLDPRDVVFREYGVQLRREPGRRRLRPQNPTDQSAAGDQLSVAQTSSDEAKVVRRRSLSFSAASSSSPSTTSTDTHTHLVGFVYYRFSLASTVDIEITASDLKSSKEVCISKRLYN